MPQHVNLVSVAYDCEDVLHSPLPRVSEPAFHAQAHNPLSEQVSNAANTAAMDALTRNIDPEAFADSWAMSNIDTLHVNQVMEEEPDLSLGYGDQQYVLHEFLASSSEENDGEAHMNPISSASMLVEDTIDNPDAAAESPSGLDASVSTCKAISGEQDLWEKMAAASNQRFTSSFCMVSPTGLLPAINGGFPPSLHEDKVFFCKFCDRQFHSSQALGGHQNAHKRERLVARSTPRLAVSPPFFRSRRQLLASPVLDNVGVSAQLQLSYRGGDGSRNFPVAAVMGHDPSLRVASMCKDGVRAAHPVFTMYQSCPGPHYRAAPDNVYIIGNRSLGIKAHSLVHRPGAVHTLHVTPQVQGHDKGQLGWPKVAIVGGGGIDVPGGSRSWFGSMHTAAARFEGTSAAPNLSAASRFPCLHGEEPRELNMSHSTSAAAEIITCCRSRSQAPSCPFPTSTTPLVDSNTTVGTLVGPDVDLALHL